MKKRLFSLWLALLFTLMPGLQSASLSESELAPPGVPAVSAVSAPPAVPTEAPTPAQGEALPTPAAALASVPYAPPAEFLETPPAAPALFAASQPLPQAIIVSGLENKTYGDDPFSLVASPDPIAQLDRFSYHSSNPAVAEISAAGQITLKSGGTATISVTEPGNDDYAPYVWTKQLTVAKQSLKVSVGSESITYGDPLPAWSLTYAGFVNGEDESDLDKRPSVCPAVTGKLGANAEGYILRASGGLSNRYAFVYESGLLHVAKKDVAVLGLAVYDREYQSGRRNAVVQNFGYSIQGMLAGDDVKIDMDALTAEFDNDAAGNHKNVTISGIALAGADRNNYNLTATTACATASIKAGLSAQEVATAISVIPPLSPTPVRMEMPAVPEGFTVGIEVSSHPAVHLDGSLSPVDFDAYAALVFRVTKVSDGSFGFTYALAFTLPATAKHMVTVTATDGGAVLGGGAFPVNLPVALSAIPSAGYQFDGWYEHGEAVCGEAAYCFAATADRTLEARFRPSSLRLSKSFLVLKKLECSQLEAYTPGALQSTADVEWKSSNEGVATVDSSGLVLATGMGSAIISGYSQELDIAGECRVDVTEAPVGGTVQGVRLLQTAVACNALSTAYAQIPLQLILAQNMALANASGDDFFQHPVAQSIRSATLLNDPGRYFTTRILDDRYVQLIPSEALKTARVTSLKTRLSVDVDGATFTTNELTLKIARTKPTLKAAAIKFNSFFPSQPVPVSVTSSIGNVTGVRLLDVLDAPLVIFDENAGTLCLQHSGSKPKSLCLRVTVDAFADPFDVPLRVSTAMAKPTVKLSARSVTMYQSATLRVTGPRISGLSIANHDDYTVTSPDPDGLFTLRYMGEGVVPLSSALQLAVYFHGTDQTLLLPLTVKKPPTGNPKVVLSPAAVTLNQYTQTDQVTVQVSTTPVDAPMPSITGDTTLFDVATADKQLTLRLKPETVSGKSYKLNVGGALLTVRVLNQPPQVKLAAKGKLDVINPESLLTLTPAFTGCHYGGGAVTVSHEDFEISGSTPSGVVTLRMKDIAEKSKTRQSLAITYSTPGGDIVSASVLVTPAQSKPKLYQSSKQLFLQRNDVYSEAVLDIAILSPGSATIADVRVNAKHAHLYDVRKVQNGTYALGFKDHAIGNVGKGAAILLDVYARGTAVPVPIKVSVVIQ